MDHDYYEEGISFAFVRLFGLGEFAEYGSIENRNMIHKDKLMLKTLK